MKIAEKDLKFYWHIIKWPVIILVAWSVVGLALALTSFVTYRKVFTSPGGLILGIAAFAFIGWTAVKDHKASVVVGSWAGAIAGVIIGLFGAALSLLMFQLVPGIVEEAIAQAVQMGAPAELAKQFMSIGIYLAFVTGPLLNGIMGAIVAAISSFIATKVK